MLATISQLFRKMYNPRNFKGCCPQASQASRPQILRFSSLRSDPSSPRIVSPHEFYQAVGRVTQKKPQTRGDADNSKVGAVMPGPLA